MAIYKFQRRLYFNKERFNAGIKGAVNGAKNGAMIGSILAPGNLISYVTGHKKLAAGLTIGGALLGAGIGSKLGWQANVNKYDYDHETDPVKLKEREDQNKKRISDQIDTIKRDDSYFYKRSTSSIIQDYKKLENKYNIRFPQDWYKYCKFIIDFYKTLKKIINFGMMLKAILIKAKKSHTQIFNFQKYFHFLTQKKKTSLRKIE